MQSALSISTEGSLVFSRVAHPTREFDWLFPAVNRHVKKINVVRVWIANRQTNPRIDAKQSNRWFRNTVALLVAGQLAFV